MRVQAEARTGAEWAQGRRLSPISSIVVHGDQYLFIDAQGVRGGKVATFFLYQDTLVDLCKKVLERLGYKVEKVSDLEKEAGHQN